MSTILFGETQADLAIALRDCLSASQFTVHLENSGLRVLESLRHNHYDLLVLETALPGLDGISVVREYRARGGGTPVVLLAANHSSEELQRGLDAGAEVYLVKPFHLDDLAARLRALLRRPVLKSGQVLVLGDIVMDTAAGTVTRNETFVHLHPMEFKLLQFLLSHPNQVVSSHALFERVWQKSYAHMDNTVRTHVKTLRQKIDTEGCTSHIETVRGLGYKACIPTHT